MSKYISKYAPHQTVKIPNLEQYVAIFPKGTGTRPIPKKVRKIPVLSWSNMYLTIMKLPVLMSWNGRWRHQFLCRKPWTKGGAAEQNNVFFIKLCIKIFCSTQSGYQRGITWEALQLKEIKRWGYTWISCIRYPTRFSAIFTCSGHCRLYPDVWGPRAPRWMFFLTFCWQRLCRKPCFVCIKTI